MSDTLSPLTACPAALVGEETTRRVDALVARAEALPRWSDAEQRLALATEARALARRLGYEAGYAAATVATAYAHLLRSDPLAALTLYLEAEHHEALLPAKTAVWVQTGLANVYSDLGDVENVLKTLSLLLERVRAAGDREQEAWTLHGLSRAASDLGDASGGLALGQKALAAFTALHADTGLDVDHGVLRAHAALGTACRLLGRLDEARDHHEASLDLARRLGAAPAEARALHDLAVLALAENRPEDALLLLGVALDRWHALGNRQSEASSLLELGRALQETCCPDEAIGVMEQALAVANDLGATLQASRAHLALADAYEALGQPGRALDHLRHHLAAREEVLQTETVARLRSLAAQAEARRARDDADRARRHADDVSLKNNELEALLAELNRTQARLVQFEKLASLGRLTAGIAHEIKNPLNFVTNFARLSVEMAAELREALAAGDMATVGEISADLQANAAAILHHGERADAVVAAMMAHAHRGTGARRPADLPALVRQAAEAARQTRAGQGGTPPPEVTLALDPAVGEVSLVPEEVAAAVAGLVDNALQAARDRAEAGEPGLYVPAVTVALRAAGGAAEVSVEDNGAGMTDEVRARAFEPFFTTRPAGEGTGLGLSMAWDVAEGHGGSLTAAPAPGGGERFVLRLPLGLDAARPTATRVTVQPRRSAPRPSPVAGGPARSGATPRRRNAA